MSELHVASQAHRAEPVPSIEIELPTQSDAAYAAVVRLCGEHDIVTSAELGAALCTIFGSVLIDLTPCEFIDSTIISALIVDFRRRRREGHRLALLVPPENAAIARTLAISGVDALLAVHGAEAEALQLPA